MGTTTPIKIRPNVLTFKQLGIAIAFVENRFDLRFPTHSQLATLISYEFNTEVTEHDIDLYYDTNLEDEVLDSVTHQQTLGFHGPFSFFKGYRRAMRNERLEDDGDSDFALIG